MQPQEGPSDAPREGPSEDPPGKGQATNAPDGKTAPDRVEAGPDTKPEAAQDAPRGAGQAANEDVGPGADPQAPGNSGPDAGTEGGTPSADAPGSSTTPQPVPASLADSRDVVLEAIDAGSAASPKKRKRPHPYANEATTPREAALDAGKVTWGWLGLATAMTLVGLWLNTKYSSIAGSEPSSWWLPFTLIPLFAGLGLLGFGMKRARWVHKFTITGWLLFAFYWSLAGRDLFVSEGQDYVNFLFSIVGVYFFTYLAYHEWLSLVRGVDNGTLHFLNVATFVAGGSYFLIDKIQWLRLNLIYVVSDHTKWMLDLFGQGDKAGIVFLTDAADNKSPTTFFYPDQYCDPGRGDAVGQWCAENGYDYQLRSAHSDGSLWDSLLLYTPDGDLAIYPVSIILACTALQSIMLFVGLFAGTDATWQRKLKASLIVGGIVYILNLVRNTGIIWFYGQGHASFWVMHNAIGKGGSLLAMIAIAFAAFRWFPEFFKALVGVLDLPDRDGPMERTLKIGRRRPPPVQAAAPAIESP